MANIMDYLEWRGDLTFAQSPFNEVDNLILSELVYVEFAGIVPSPGKGSITLEEANTAFFSTHTDEEINARVSSTKVAAFMMREMAKTNRFGKIKLSAYINDIRVEEQSQFCAMVVELGDGLCNVVYSGTDNTIVGWKEDFNMSFLSETPGQLKAVAYLEMWQNIRMRACVLWDIPRGAIWRYMRQFTQTVEFPEKLTLYTATTGRALPSR